MTTEIRKVVVLLYGSGTSAQAEVCLTLDEYTAHQGPETALFEEKYRVTWGRIVEWHQMQGLQQCSALTKRGHRCKGLVGGRRFSSPTDWDAADKAGGYCFAHSGETPNAGGNRRAR